MSSNAEQYAAFQMLSGNEPTECGNCGSTDIFEESAAEGWSCRTCKASDSDE